MIFRFTMLSDESDSFLRSYEIDSDATLDDFHKFICADLGFDDGQLVSFFTSDLMWEKLHEYTLVDMGGESDIPASSMEGVTLGAILPEEHARLIYLFDIFGDRALYLELMSIAPGQSGAEYPRCVTAEGEAPGQFDADAGGDGSAFDDMMSDFSGFEGDDAYDDE